MKHQLIALATLTSLVALDIALGFRAPWWTFAVPAFFVGWLIPGKMVRVAALAAAIAWMSIAISHDLPTGFRLSMRIAGVVGLKGFLFSYVILALIAGAIAGLAAFAGSSLRAGLFSRSLPRVSE